MDYTFHGTLQARILEWVTFPLSRGLPNPGIEPRSPKLQVDSLPAEPPGKPSEVGGPFLPVCSDPWSVAVTSRKWQGQDMCAEPRGLWREGPPTAQGQARRPHPRKRDTGHQGLLEMWTGCVRPETMVLWLEIFSDFKIMGRKTLSATQAIDREQTYWFQIPTSCNKTPKSSLIPVYSLANPLKLSTRSY